jgi:hypothetical protein
VHLVFAQATVSTGTPVTANCPTGELALSGGWASDPNTPIYNSSRTGGGSGNGWRIFPYTSGALTNSYVMCLRNDPGASITQRQVMITVGAGTSGNSVAACNSGEVVVGGGFANPTPGVEIYNFTAQSNGWGGYAKNNTGSLADVFFYAECLISSGAHTTFTLPPAQTSVPGSGTGSTQITCPGSSLLSGGGYADQENAIVYSSSPNNSTTWEAALKDNSGSSNLLNVYAMCLSFS